MNNPIRHLKSLPWLPLLQIAALTHVIIIAAEIILLWAAQFPLVVKIIKMLFAPPLGLLMPFIIALGVGALAVYILEQWKTVYINTATLWCLIACLFLGLVLKSLSPLPSLLLFLEQISVFGMIVGVFWKGRPYWRYWR